MPREETSPINIRVSPEEKERIVQYCKITGRNQTDVLREFIRSLEVPAQVA